MKSIEQETSTPGMYVVNRKGLREDVSFDQILKRLTKLCFGLHNLVDPVRISQKVINGMYAGIETRKLDSLAAETCAAMAATHPDYSKLAARISVDNLHKETHKDFYRVMQDLHEYKDNSGRESSLISVEVFAFISTHRDAINNAICYERDFEYDFFGFKTLERSYLLRIHGQPVERPQHMMMRVACGIHYKNSIEEALKTYDLMSKKYFTHATPTLFNAGTPRPQMSSCFLLAMQSDSIDGIFETLRQCALISKTAGGIGISVSNIRASRSYIRGTNGYSNGLVPMLRVFNDTARYVDQGGGKRKGSFAIYLEPWHADVFEFLNLRKNHGKEEVRCRDLFIGLWVPDLFMRRVKHNGDWTLFCPNECPGLQEAYGENFDELYQKYESEGKGRQTFPAQKLWFAILEAQVETGTPYILYKDSCNKKSNQQNLGTIKSSNLCTEIIQYTSADEIAVCNLASLALPKYVNVENKIFDYTKLYQVTKVVTKNLNTVIDVNYYPVKEAETSNMRHRPIGIGVQGLADAFLLLKYPFESDEARTLNKNIFETIYFAAAEASMELAKETGETYDSFKGSPASEGRLQFDLWGVTPSSGLWDWNKLKGEIMKYGMRNSLLVAPMPTASTSQILGNNEAFEPYTCNIYNRRVLSGEFFVVNPHLLRDLIDLGLWDDNMKQKLMAENGSVQYIDEIPAHIRELYKTVWEIKQRSILDMAADRGPFIDQSQSLNIHIKDANFSKLTSMHFYGWKLGLKTGIYYLRTQSASDAIKFTVDTSVMKISRDNVKRYGPAMSTSSMDTRDTSECSPRISATPSVEGGFIFERNSVNSTAQSCPLKRADASNEEECLMCSG